MIINYPNILIGMGVMAVSILLVWSAVRTLTSSSKPKKLNQFLTNIEQASSHLHEAHKNLDEMYETIKEVQKKI
jgi:hypothetical protein